MIITTLLARVIHNQYIENMKINSKFLVILIAAVLCCGGYFAWNYLDNNEEKISYVDFMQCVEAGDVSSVKFDGDTLHFTVKTSPKKFKTQNPNSPVLQEELMKPMLF